VPRSCHFKAIEAISACAPWQAMREYGIAQARDPNPIEPMERPINRSFLTRAPFPSI